MCFQGDLQQLLVRSVDKWDITRKVVRVKEKLIYQYQRGNKEKKAKTIKGGNQAKKAKTKGRKKSSENQAVIVQGSQAPQLIQD